jgi:hypothetical protein
MPKKTPKKHPQSPPEEPSLDEMEHPQDHHFERSKLIENPNLNQAGNNLGSGDNTEGLQTGNDITE